MKQKNEQEETKEVKVEQFFYHGVTFTLGEVENKIHIAWGPNIVSYRNFETFNEAKEYIKQKPYDIILGLSACIVEQSKKNNL